MKRGRTYGQVYTGGTDASRELSPIPAVRRVEPLPPGSRGLYPYIVLKAPPIGLIWCRQVAPSRPRDLEKACRVATTGPVSFDGHRLPRLHPEAILPLIISFKAPFNEIKNEARVFTYQDTAIVTPNSDTPYSPGSYQ